MTQPIDRRVAARVTYSRLLLRNAKEIFNRNDTITAGLALLGAQDATEMMLRAMAEHHSIAIGTVFDKAIESIDEHFKNNGSPVRVPRRTALMSLNKARVGFKHQGNLPDIKDAEDHLLQAQLACAEASIIFLGVPLESFSLADLIEAEKVRMHIKSAEAYYAEEKYQDALVEAGSGFARVFGNAGGLLRNEPKQHRRRANFDEVCESGSPRHDLREISGRFWQVQAEFDHVYSVVNEAEKWFRIYSLGVSPTKLQRFQYVVPMCQALSNGLVPVAHVRRSAPETIQGEAMFAIEFATDCILLAQKAQ